MTDQADAAAMSDDELLAEWRTTKAVAPSLEGREPPAYTPEQHRRHEALEAEAKRRGLD